MKGRAKILIVTFTMVHLTIVAQQWAIMDGGLSGQFNSMYSDTIGDKLYFHGGFQKAGNLIVNGTASWDGTKWDSLGNGVLGLSSWGPGTGFLIRYKNKLYIQSYNSRIYAWDFISQKWDSVPGGKVSGSINCATIFGNDLILAGQFAGTGSVTAKNVLRFDGTNFYPVGNPNFTWYIRSVAVFKNEIYIGGNFANDTVYSGIARWNGSQWRDCDGGLRGGGPPEVSSLHVFNNRLYIGGTYYGTKYGNSPSIAVWDSIKWTNIGGVHYEGFQWGGVMNMFTFQKKLFVFGGFDWAGDQHVNAPIAIWNDTSWCSSKAILPSSMLWLASIYKNEVYVASSSSYLGSDSINFIGKWIGGQFIDSCSIYTGANDLDKNNEFKIYPNPVGTNLNIKILNFKKRLTYNIYNALGQIVMKGNIDGFESVINVSDISSGIYFLEISDGKNRSNTKFIKHE